MSKTKTGRKPKKGDTERKWNKMKMSWIKYAKDDESFKVPERLGFDVFKLAEPEDTDAKIEELVQKRYDFIILTDQIAGFSEDIIKKYNNDRNVSIIIARNKE